MSRISPLWAITPLSSPQSRPPSIAPCTPYQEMESESAYKAMQTHDQQLGYAACDIDCLVARAGSSDESSPSYTDADYDGYTDADYDSSDQSSPSYTDADYDGVSDGGDGQGYFGDGSFHDNYMSTYDSSTDSYSLTVSPNVGTRRPQLTRKHCDTCICIRACAWHVPTHLETAADIKG